MHQPPLVNSSLTVAVAFEFDVAVGTDLENLTVTTDGSDPGPKHLVAILVEFVDTKPRDKSSVNKTVHHKRNKLVHQNVCRGMLAAPTRGISEVDPQHVC